MRNLTQSLKEVKRRFRKGRASTSRNLFFTSFKLCVKLLPGFLSLTAAAQPASPLLPLPAQTTWGRAALPLKSPLSLVLETDLDPRVAAAARQTIKLLPNGSAAPAAGPTLQIRYGRTGVAEKQDEEMYNLRITPLGISILAPTSLGALRALATLAQLPRREGRRWVLPETDIQDRPRFAWRGLLIDAARHFLPVAVIKRNIDGMAAVKLNVLHWHLTDDQGFRVESKTFPRLHQVGSTDGLYYTQAEVREVLAYAAARGIRVVPEFDVPSHTTSWIVAYPRLRAIDSTYAPYQLWRTTNVAIDPTRETTYSFLDSLLTEMTGLFPDPYFHIGGDENDGRNWRRSPRIVAFMREKGFVRKDGQPDKSQLQTYFNRRVLALVQRQGKIMVGWDEILGPDLPAPIVIESWRGPKGVAEAVRRGHPALRAHGYYLDLMHPAATHYAADPLQGVPDSLAHRVLGGEAAMWGEFADSIIYESRVWPRAAAVAERLWSPAALTQNVPDMYRRLALVNKQLDAMGLRHRRAPARLLPELAGPGATAVELAALRELAAVVEPVKDYQRHFQGFTYTTETRLNRLVDIAAAESEVARRFAAAVDSLLGRPATGPARTAVANEIIAMASAAPLLRTAANRAQIKLLREQLQTWQQTDFRLAPLLARQPALREYAPLSANLSALATLLLLRLTQLESSAALPAGRAPARLLLPAPLSKPAGQATLAPALLRAASQLLQ